MPPRRPTAFPIFTPRTSPCLSRASTQQWCSPTTHGVHSESLISARSFAISLCIVVRAGFTKGCSKHLRMQVELSRGELRIKVGTWGIAEFFRIFNDRGMFSSKLCTLSSGNFELLWTISETKCQETRRVSIFWKRTLLPERRELIVIFSLKCVKLHSNLELRFQRVWRVDFAKF